MLLEKPVILALIYVLNEVIVSLVCTRKCAGTQVSRFTQIHTAAIFSISNILFPRNSYESEGRLCFFITNIVFVITGRDK
jgi:hypothetical protein